MAGGPDNVVLLLLREIRATQDEHGRRLECIETRLSDLTQRMGRLEGKR